MYLMGGGESKLLIIQDGDKELKIKDSVESLDDLKPENVKEKQNWDGVSWYWNDDIFYQTQFEHDVTFTSNDRRFSKIKTLFGKNEPPYWRFLDYTEISSNVEETLGDENILSAPGPGPGPGPYDGFRVYNPRTSGIQEEYWGWKHGGHIGVEPPEIIDDTTPYRLIVFDEPVTDDTLLAFLEVNATRYPPQS